MKHGIKFGDKHSYNDFKLVPTSRPVFGPPEAEIRRIEIPGRNGTLDVSEALTNGITYKERSGKFEFLVADKTDWVKTYSDILNYLHGKRMKVILDDDPTFYYDARLIANDWQSNENDSTITIEASAYPFKKKVTETVKKITGNGNINLTNLKEKVSPTITTTTEANLKYKGKSIALGIGTFETDLILDEGDNIVTVTSTGTTTFKYREGCL